MITPSLRRAGLALAAITSLSLQAAANVSSDSAFASSLAEAPAWRTAMEDLKALPQKPAELDALNEPKGPSAPDAVWQKVLETVKNSGKYKPGSLIMPGTHTFTIEDIIGDPKADHEKRSIVVFGTLNEEGQYEAMGLALAVETTKLDPKSGIRNLEIWAFDMNIFGDIEIANHGVATKSPEGKFQPSESGEVPLTDPRIQEKFDAMLKHWAERKP